MYSTFYTSKWIKDWGYRIRTLVFIASVNLDVYSTNLGFEPWCLQHLAFVTPAKLDIDSCLLKDSKRGLKYKRVVD